MLDSKRGAYRMLRHRMQSLRPDAEISIPCRRENDRVSVPRKLWLVIAEDSVGYLNPISFGSGTALPQWCNQNLGGSQTSGLGPLKQHPLIVGRERSMIERAGGCR